MVAGLREIVIVAVVGVVAACASATPAPQAAADTAAVAARPAAGDPAPAAGAATGSAPAAPPERLALGLSTPSAIYAGAYVAKEAGLFDRSGLDVDLPILGSGVPAQAALVSGELKMAAVSGPTTLSVVLAGGDLTMVGAVFDTMPFQLVATREFASPADLRGKIIGINRLGGSPHWVLRYMMRHAGVDLDSDATVLQVGQQAERVAALRNGGVQATIVDPPFSVVAEREGLRVIANAADLGMAYPHATLVMSRETLRSQRDTARRVLQGVVDGNRAFKTDRELGIRALRRGLEIDDQALLEDAYNYFSRLMPEEVLPRAEGLQLILDEAATEQPTARGFQPQDLVDPTLARELR